MPCGNGAALCAAVQHLFHFYFYSFIHLIPPAEENAASIPFISRKFIRCFQKKRQFLRPDD